MSSNSAIEKVISRIGDLPAIPEVVSDVMSLTLDPNISVSEVSRLIERDPALTAKLLKVSNSAYYGMRQVVGTLKLALVILGVPEVRNLVLGISMLDAFKGEDTDFLMSEDGIWTHSAQVAALSKKLGAHLELRLHGEDFIAGLLHDIGIVVLWEQVGKEYRQLYQRTQRADLPLHTAEMEAFGFDHADVAQALAESWRLPTSLSFAMGAHHPREDRVLNEGPSPRLAALVRIANAASTDDFGRIDEPAPISCTDEEAWAILSEDGDQLTVAERREMLGSFVEDLNMSPSLSL